MSKQKRKINGSSYCAAGVVTPQITREARSSSRYEQRLTGSCDGHAYLTFLCFSGKLRDRCKPGRYSHIFIQSMTLPPLLARKECLYNCIPCPLRTFFPYAALCDLFLGKTLIISRIFTFASHIHGRSIRTGPFRHCGVCQPASVANVFSDHRLHRTGAGFAISS